MSYIVRAITPDEYSAWDQMVIESPQAGLFQTILWNQMLVETGTVEQSWVPIVYESKEQLLGGIIVRYVVSNGKKTAVLPAFGYNGPVIASSLNYQERHTTFNSYQVLTELLQHVQQTVDRALIYNQPEIWDMRAFRFLDWSIETTYIHRLHCNERNIKWFGDDSPQQKIRDTIEKYSLVESRNYEKQVQRFCRQVVRTSRSGSYPSRSARALEKRIHWMTERNLCKLVSLIGPNERELAISLLILSKENKTIYLWDSVYLNHLSEVDILPSLIYWLCQSIPIGFERIDFSNSSNPVASRLKDQLGLELIPNYIARYR